MRNIFKTQWCFLSRRKFYLSKICELPYLNFSLIFPSAWLFPLVFPCMFFNRKIWVWSTLSLYSSRNSPWYSRSRGEKSRIKEKKMQFVLVYIIVIKILLIFFHPSCFKHFKTCDIWGIIFNFSHKELFKCHFCFYESVWWWYFEHLMIFKLFDINEEAL